ncbi:hypothetical protein HYV86_02960 [Candidatus Woesearchaeota archaeon]|nr:hypothetical protein [Candidatus Woesearchaeota archaeon]
MEMCKKCCGITKLIVGALILINAFLWPQWLGIDGWVKFTAVLLVLGGFLMLVIPTGKCCMEACSMDKSPSASKKR